MDPRLRAAELAKRSDREVDVTALEAFAAGHGTLAAALALDAEELRVLRAHGMALLDAGHTRDAIAIFEALVAAGLDDAPARFLLADAYRSTGELAAAVVHFSRGLEKSETPELAPVREAALVWGRHLLSAVGER